MFWDGQSVRLSDKLWYFGKKLLPDFSVDFQRFLGKVKLNIRLKANSRTSKLDLDDSTLHTAKESTILC